MAFSWTQLIPGVGHEYAHIATLGVVSVGLVGLAGVARKQLGKGSNAVTPTDRFSVRAVFETITELIQGLVDMVIGEHGRKYIPFFASVFTFILINNLVGIIPGMAPATEQINTTFAMGLFMFLVYNYLGLKENGLAYLKHFLGPVLLLAPLMVVIELISHMVRPFSLGLRLANVMAGDHIVVGTFLELVPYVVPIPFYLLGIFVSIVQATVFTLLSMVYVALATAHEEH